MLLSVHRNPFQRIGDLLCDKTEDHTLPIRTSHRRGNRPERLLCNNTSLPEKGGISPGGKKRLANPLFYRVTRSASKNEDSHKYFVELGSAKSALQTEVGRRIYCKRTQLQFAH